MNTLDGTTAKAVDCCTTTIVDDRRFLQKYIKPHRCSYPANKYTSIKRMLYVYGIPQLRIIHEYIVLNISLI